MDTGQTTTNILLPPSLLLFTVRAAAVCSATFSSRRRGGGRRGWALRPVEENDLWILSTGHYFWKITLSILLIWIMNRETELTLKNSGTSFIHPNRIASLRYILHTSVCVQPIKSAGTMVTIEVKGWCGFFSRRLQNARISPKIHLRYFTSECLRMSYGSTLEIFAENNRAIKYISFLVIE